MLKILLRATTWGKKFFSKHNDFCIDLHKGLKFGIGIVKKPASSIAAAALPLLLLLLLFLHLHSLRSYYFLFLLITFFSSMPRKLFVLFLFLELHCQYFWFTLSNSRIKHNLWTLSVKINYYSKQLSFNQIY